MRIAVIGAGAIGGLVAGYLKQKGRDVRLIAHLDSVAAIRQNGLNISGCRGSFNIPIEISATMDFPADLVILATKSQDLAQALKENQKLLRDTPILTTQNGVQADNIASSILPKENIISSIVMFGATRLTPGEVVHNFEGSWIIGKMDYPNDARVIEVVEELGLAFTSIAAENIKGMKYLKVFVNANNCIPAILGLSMQEAFSDPEVSAVSIAIWKEGLEVMRQAVINLESLPDFPLERLTKLAALPTQEAAKIFSGIMMNLSKEPVYGSILQSIKRGKPSEIDYINGEFINLAKSNNLRAPLNEKLVEMVHEVERSGKFYSKTELIEQTKNSIS